MADQAQGRVALVLGAGGLYGFAHIGVLSVLERNALRPDLIVGCSVGAVIGALYGGGLSAQRLQELARHLRRGHWLDLAFARMGVIAGKRMEGVLRLLTKDRRLEELSPPLAVVATDVERGERVVFTRGSAAVAARASSAVPGIFTPVRVDGRLFVDGALLERVPVRVARELGAERVVAVALGLQRAGQIVPVHNLFDVAMQAFDIMQREVVRSRSDVADVLIEPRVEQLSAPSHLRAEAFMQAGMEAAEAKLDQLREAFVGRRAVPRNV